MSPAETASPTRAVVFLVVFLLTAVINSIRPCKNAVQFFPLSKGKQGGDLWRKGGSFNGVCKSHCSSRSETEKWRWLRFPSLFLPSLDVLFALRRNFQWRGATASVGVEARENCLGQKTRGKRKRKGERTRDSKRKEADLRREEEDAFVLRK